MNNNNKSIKVKVFYTLRGSKSTRLTTFPMTVDQETNDLSMIPIPLKTCLWSICSSSPDMICRDHDLSIYTANFHESTNIEKRDSLIWEGHGLMTWIMDQQSSSIIEIYGKLNQTTADCIDVYIELQPTMKWIKDDYFSALRNKSFEQFKNSTQTPLHPICQCYHQIIEQQQKNALPSPYNHHTETEFDRYLKQRIHQDEASPPLPSRTTVFRPEPIFPPASTSSQQQTSSNNKRTRLNSPSYYNNNKDDLTLPIPSSMNRRSAFTIASISDNNNGNKYISQPPTAAAQSNSTSSISSSTSPPPSSSLKNSDDIPVIYTPSNKKRKKNPIIMPAAAANNNNNNNNASSNNELYQQQTSSTLSSSQQQVNNVVRTYYEVDRDNQGAYILPVEIDSWTVVDLGTVIYERPAYHNQRYIYPANYTVRKWYRSMVDPKSDTQYTCRILENGREPKFEVTADDCPMTYSGPTPTTVWTIIVRRAFAIRNQEYGHNPVGPDFFGLRKNTIAKMIQDLPNASKCSQYVWQTFEPARFNKPGRNRRRADSTLPGSLLGGVNYGLTSSRLIHNTNLTSTQHSYRATTSPKQQQDSESPRQEQEATDHNINHHQAIVESA